MTRTLYALLVGIDQYQPPVPALHGCVNDITSVEALLRNRLVNQDFAFKPLRLLDAAATRQAVIDGFHQHLSQAGADDVALFYYSGHGSQEPAPLEFWTIEPDRRDETIVCYDSRTEGRYDLADKELGKLIGEVAQRGPHVVVVLDCCHSGSGTRNAEELDVRRAPTDLRERPIESFIVRPEELAGSRDATASPSGWSAVTRSKPILLAACRSEEEAKEYNGGGQRRGAFSYFLTTTLERTGGQLTYRDLFARTSALVRSSVAVQAPQIEVVDVADLDRPFLGGAVAGPSPYFTLSHDRTLGWVIDGGAVHGVAGPQPAANGAQTTRLALFPFNSTPEQLRDLRGSVGAAEVTQALANQSAVTLTLHGGAQPDPSLTFKAVVTDVPIAPLAVQLTGDAAAVTLLRQALATASAKGGPSVYVREVGPGDTPQLRVAAENQRYRMLRPADSYPLTADLDGYAAATARQAVERLEHIARWQTLLDLANPTTRLPANAIRLDLYRVTGPPVTRDPSSAPSELLTSSAFRLEYARSNGQWRPPLLKAKLTNTSGQRLYCALLDLTELFAVQSGLFAAGGVWLAPDQEAWALDGQPFNVIVPDALWSQGATQYVDVLKLIVSSEEFDPRYLEQAALDAPQIERATRSLAGMGALDRLLQHAVTRDIVAAGAATTLADWSVDQVTITTVRPLEQTQVPTTGLAAPLAAGVRLEPHTRLQAQARLTNAPEAARDLGALALPSILLDDPAVSQPFLFSAGRGGAPGLSVLELSEVADPSVVTPDEPLLLHVDAALGAHEHVLPIGFDGELFLPLGSARSHAGGTTIAIDRLPDPLSEGQRSLTGSIKIFFQKVLSERLGGIIGGEYAYPLLAAAYVANDGATTYWTRPAELQPRVADAQRILLYIHGIIGDTRGMAASVRCAECKELPLPPALIDRYDLILTFDYENINTTIEETARSLKQRLAAVGLGPDHGKTLHIAAHSMGGLVARWFIEREGGNRVVQHLVMLGTPNAGSPWPSVQGWATTALGIGLNSLSTVAWPVKALGTLVGAIETVDVTLDQMMPGSQFLRSLEASDDPGVRYTIIAGNTALRPQALRPEPNTSQSRFARLLGKLKPRGLLQGAAGLAFFGQPNDLAVSVQSICELPTDRTPAPEVREVSCDHITYFTTAAGLRALADALD
jgi:hypothetical protein